MNATAHNLLSHLPKHTSAFTRAVPPRGLTMHVSIPPPGQKGSAGARRRARFSGCLATAGKTRLRAPFGVFSSANSTVCAHPDPGPEISRGMGLCAIQRTPRVLGLVKRHPGEVPSRGRLMRGCTSSPHARHRFRLAHIAMRGSRGKNGRDCAMELEEWEDERGLFSYNSDQAIDFMIKKIARTVPVSVVAACCSCLTPRSGICSPGQ